MISRRRFLVMTALGSAGVAFAGYTLNARNTRAEYEALAQRIWRHSKGDFSTDPARMLEFVRYATLAPSSHNTQCWKFRVGKDSIAIFPDFQRRCPVVDPDDHHLFVSLGCAAENLVQAAAANGIQGRSLFNAHGDESVTIALKPTKPIVSPLFEAIPVRQSTRGEYDGRQISSTELRLLEKAGSGNGINVLLLTDRKAIERVIDFVIQGNTSQMRDQAFVKELKDWIRFNGAHAARTGDGLFSGSSGNPSVPTWLGKLMFDLFFTEEAENDKYAKHIRSSSGIAVFISERDNKAHWVETGRSFQRFALQATALGIRHAHLNQPVEVESIRPEFASFLGMKGKRPDLVVRFGRGPEMPRSLRRPLENVILE